jgi:flagellar motor switch protein FliN/FliY
VNGGRAQLERALFAELRSRLGAALAGLAGKAPAISGDPLPSGPAGEALRWRQSLNPLPGAVWIAATENSWKSTGRLVLEAAGVETSDDSELKSTFFEVVQQALAGFAQALTSRLGSEVTPANGVESPEAPAATRWAEAHVDAGAHTFAWAIGLEPDLLNALYREPEIQPPESGVPAVTSSATPLEPRTLDVLLDVELPVSVSFGRAQVPLKDVLKLSTGSIVELNRSISEPVEIIVNNCVIARGEVVVVEGNFGVRIQEVISRQERLRTLQ